ncbi:AAA family ATPase [Gordonia sp. NPDC003425]
MVQFHPAYSYEDFFEGFRPAMQSNGQVGFELRPGPLRKLVDRAMDNPDAVYVLIIDEINRGNLAKIFGELYFLLEYRDQSIDVLYKSEKDNAKPFMLPRNGGWCTSR